MPLSVASGINSFCHDSAHISFANTCNKLKVSKSFTSMRFLFCFRNNVMSLSCHCLFCNITTQCGLITVTSLSAYNFPDELADLLLFIFYISSDFRSFEPPHDKTNKMACAPSEDSDQPGYPPSLIRVFAVRMKKAWVLGYPLSA